MVNLGFWQLATDLLLLCSLVYLSFQFVRSPRINAQLRAVRELESALRVLVREADGAGRSLNDQLMRRQQALEKALIDADLTEQRLQKVVAAQSPSAATIEATASARNTTRQTRTAPDAEETTNSQLRRSIEVGQDNPQAQWNKVNIYGEPIQAEPISEAKAPGRAQQRAMRTYSPLKAAVQTEIVAEETPMQPTPSKRSERIKPSAVKEAEDAIEDLYATAEELLRAGEGLALVAARTNLPISDIRALSQMIIGERAVAETKQGPLPPVVDEDPRLGVMATMKRQTITL
jgi:hypothetical protein